MHWFYLEEISAVELCVAVGCIKGSSSPLLTETILCYSYRKKNTTGCVTNFVHYVMSHVPCFMEIV